ncbi:hypothetical protein Vadar_023019 [Vaccinium darrowii]|uniref:Uncharacterized protein n=1 Tax=Vaccinium darrowii TaxID=229202 RepID=A0ACB7Y1X3_9ERIC|nr:hypothetical protein Vadar_023019 [Vaccinium darrowii]
MGQNTVQPSTLMSDFLRQCGGYAFIDGGAATEFERRGADLNDPLWSAKYLISSPHLIRKQFLKEILNELCSTPKGKQTMELSSSSQNKINLLRIQVPNKIGVYLNAYSSKLGFSWKKDEVFSIGISPVLYRILMV